jgi:NADH:ubiquinone oxidoreductase subunit K
MSVNHYLILSSILFCIGLYGILTRKNAIMVLMSVEIVLNAANLNFAAFSTIHNPTGQVFALFAIVVGAAEVAAALAIFFLAFRLKERIDLDSFNLLKQ